MNMVHVSGNIGAEPEFKLFESGKRKASFSVALIQYRKNNEENETVWIPCLAWDAVCDRLLRCREKTNLSGRKIIVTGSFVQSKWIDQITGKKQTKLMVKVLVFELLSSAPQEQVLSNNGQDQAAIAQDQPSLADVEALFEGKPLNQPRRHSSNRAKTSG